MKDAPHSLVVERQMAAPPEKLWRALTTPHLIADWLMANDFAATAGHRFKLQSEPKPDVTVTIDCEVLTIEPHRTLSYRWSAFGLDSIVTFTLTPRRGGTLLRMEQEGFAPDQRAAWGGAKLAWPTYLTALDRVASNH